MIKTLKFPFSFDIAALRADLDRFTASEWVPHYNKHYYEGDWSAIALRDVKDTIIGMHPEPTRYTYAETPMMERCNYFGKVLGQFECEKNKARLMRLGPGDRIHEHNDAGLRFENGLARIHIPIKTSPHIEFYLDNEVVSMGPGEAWYLNFDLMHRVENKGIEERVHLVIDCVVNDWLAGFFAE
jgi:quercetin dioxygenase-like cupin family protein